MRVWYSLKSLDAERNREGWEASEARSWSLHDPKQHTFSPPHEDCIFQKKKIIAKTDVKEFTTYFSSMSFMVSGSPIKLYIQFELIFVNGVRSVSRFIFFACGCSVVPTSFFERLSLSIVLPLFLSKISWLYLCGFISGLSILFHWSICLFLCQYHVFFFLL